MVVQRGGLPRRRQKPVHGGSLVRVQSGDEHAFFPVGAQRLHHPRDLLRGLARAVNDLRRALPGMALEIHPGIAELRHRRRFQLRQRVINAQRAAAHLLQKLSGFVHRAPPCEFDRLIYVL